MARIRHESSRLFSFFFFILLNFKNEANFFFFFYWTNNLIPAKDWSPFDCSSHLRDLPCGRVPTRQPWLIASRYDFGLERISTCAASAWQPVPVWLQATSGAKFEVWKVSRRPLQKGCTVFRFKSAFLFFYPQTVRVVCCVHAAAAGERARLSVCAISCVSSTAFTAVARGVKPIQSNGNTLESNSCSVKRGKTKPKNCWRQVGLFEQLLNDAAV